MEHKQAEKVWRSRDIMDFIISLRWFQMLARLWEWICALEKTISWASEVFRFSNHTFPHHVRLGQRQLFLASLHQRTSITITSSKWSHDKNSLYVVTRENILPESRTHLSIAYARKPQMCWGEDSREPNVRAGSKYWHKFITYIANQI